MVLILGAGQFCCCGYSVGKCKQLPVTGNKNKTKPLKGCREDLLSSAVSTHPQTFGCSVFWKDEATSPKNRCRKPPERITIEYIEVILCIPRGAVTPFQSFPRVWGPCAAPCLDATPWVMKQDLRKVDLPPCMALPLQFYMYHFMSSSFCFKSPPKRQ